LPGLLNEMFDCVFCINLDSRPDRWASASERFAVAGIEVERFPAIDTWSPVALGQAPSQTRWKDAVEACARSHQAAVAEAQQRGARAVFLFQDDVVLHPRFDDVLHRWIGDLPDEWALLYLGGWHPRTALDPQRGETEVPGPEHVRGHVYRLRHDFCLHACGIRDTLFDEVLSIDPGAAEPIDCSFIRLFQERGNCYGLMTADEARPGAWGLAQQDHSLGSDLRADGQLDRFEWPGW